MTTAVSTEVEISNSFPADKLFKVIANFHTLAPKVLPEVYKSITIVEGDGGPGTIQSHVYGDALPYTTSKQKIDAVDLSNLSVDYTVFEGDILSDYLDSIVHHIKISPTAEGGAMYKHTTVFNCKGEKKPTEELLNQTNEGYKKSFKAFEAYVAANAEAF
ncbi:root allergen protein-like [Bidens hawaiensis]|uniref:root allergen protein-like n=1 Tax=Bidens hawaiensis TaxID=980011 RepID=UPI00404B7BD4